MWPKLELRQDCRINNRIDTLLGNNSHYTDNNSKSGRSVGVMLTEAGGQIIINNKVVATKSRDVWTANSSEYTLPEIEVVLKSLPVKISSRHLPCSNNDFTSCSFRGMSGL